MNVDIDIKCISSSTLSYYKTQHTFKHYGEFHSIDELKHYLVLAEEKKLVVYVLGNGSNTLFSKKTIETLVLKNKIPKRIEALNDDYYRISSSVMISDVLRYCFDKSLDCFYYLASVPATIGGTLAMNAGRGKEHNQSIYDFVKCVRVYKDGDIKEFSPEEVVRGYRETIFSGFNNFFIIDAVFKFPIKKFTDNPITTRLKWSKENQDNRMPNCGSVFKEANPHILGKFKGVRIGRSQFSKKTYNWINTKSKSSTTIICLIMLVKLFHIILGKKAILEIIQVK